MEALAKDQPDTDEIVETKPVEITQAVVLSVSAERGKTRLKGSDPEPSVGVLNVTLKEQSFRMVYPRRLAVDLIAALAECLPFSDRQIAIGRVLDAERRHLA